MTSFALAVLLVAIVASGAASVVGFGIGSLLTPLLAIRFGTSLAVAAVTIPHVVATGIRCWRLRAHIDSTVLLRFGILSAIGGFGGALLYTRLGSLTLTRILGGLLLLTAAAQLTGWASRWHPHGPLVAIFGFSSGFFGGVAGNQGGLRAAALTAFGLSPATFVATATATGLLVDAARTPVYLWRGATAALLRIWPVIGVAVAGVVIGTLLGERLLLGLSVRRFGLLVGSAVGVLGLWLVLSAA